MPRQIQNKKSKDLVITRTFNASRDLVWKVWTEPKYVMRWFGPQGFTAPVVKIDLRVGGRALYCMHSPDGKDYWSTGEYREIVRPERIVITDSFSDEKGNIVSGSHYGMGEDWPRELLVTITFEEVRGKTRMTLRHSGIPHGVMVDMTGAGWNGSFDKLAEVLEEEKPGSSKTRLIAEPGKQEATIIRIFDAPRDRVFSAYTDPRLITRWWAPRHFEIIVDRMDVRQGGIWRILNRDTDGKEYAFHGVYHEVSLPTRLVYTFEFEGMPGHALLGIVTFEDREGKTKVTEKSVFESVWDRDGMLNSGMKEGGPETMDRLAELVEEKGAAGD